MWGRVFVLLLGVHAMDQTRRSSDVVSHDSHHASHEKAAEIQEQSSRRSLMRSEEQAHVDTGVTDSTQEKVVHAVDADSSSRHAVNRTNEALDEALGERAPGYVGPLIVKTDGQSAVDYAKSVAKWIIQLRDTSDWTPKGDFSTKDGGSCKGSSVGAYCKINYMDDNLRIGDGWCMEVVGHSGGCWALLNEDHNPMDYISCQPLKQEKTPELKDLCTYTQPTPAPTPYPSTPKPDEWEGFNKFYIVLGLMGLGLIAFGIYYYWYNYLQPGAHYGSHGYHGHHGHHGHGHGGTPPHMQGMHQQPPSYGQQPQGFAPTPQPMYPGQQQFGQMPQQQPYGQMPQQGFQRPPMQYG